MHCVTLIAMAFWAPGPAVRPQQNYEALVASGATVASVFAMKGTSCEAGSFNPAGSKWGLESGPWFLIGRVAAESGRNPASSVHQAIRMAQACKGGQILLSCESI